MRSQTTTVAPTGVESRYDPVSPRQKHMTESPAAKHTTERKLLNTRIADSAGKMMRLESSIAPIMRIPSTTVSAVRTDRIVLYVPTRTPVARAKDSSNVTEKSLW